MTLPLAVRVYARVFLDDRLLQDYGIDEDQRLFLSIKKDGASAARCAEASGGGSQASSLSAPAQPPQQQPAPGAATAASQRYDVTRTDWGQCGVIRLNCRYLLMSAINHDAAVFADCSESRWVALVYKRGVSGN